MTICIVGDPADLTATYLGWLARHRGIEVVELPESGLGCDWTFEFCDAELTNGILRTDAAIYPFTAIDGAFVRLNPHPRAPHGIALNPQEEAILVVERRHAIQNFLNMAPFLVANRSCAGRGNSSKPYQMRSLGYAGFRIPKWIVTNEGTKCREFTASFRSGTVYKSCSGLRSHVRLTDESLLERFRNGTSPVIVQEYVPGREVRVHVVMNRIFPTEVLSGGIDYRFDDDTGRFAATTMPQALGELCVAYAAREGLIVAGFDFRVTPDDEWYCLEMNPVPTFLPYEAATGQPIGDAILNVLCGFGSDGCASHISS